MNNNLHNKIIIYYTHRIFTQGGGLVGGVTDLSAKSLLFGKKLNIQKSNIFVKAFYR